MKDYSKVLQREVKKKIDEYTRIARGMVKAEWSKYTGGIYSDLGEAKLFLTPVIADSQGMVVRDILASGQKAWILEFGRGSLMETSSAENPWLDEYVESSDFNKWRKGNAFAITGREKGSKYYDLDGKGKNGGTEPFVSTGTLKGVNLEEWHSTKEYAPISPMKVIQSVLYGSGDNGIMRELENALLEVMADVYQRYFTEFAEKEMKEIKIKL